VAPDNARALTLLSIGRSGTVHDYARDRLGSVRNLVTTSQTLSYEPWGDTNISTGTPYTGPRFTGVYLDDTTGLYRMDARYYQPGRGRFTQLDPLPNSVLTADRYAYAGCLSTRRIGAGSTPA
jgi:RHS repeat-associated protein